jgi:hypothetical protein
VAEPEGHIYRRKVKTKGLSNFSVNIKETNILVCSERDVKRETENLVIEHRYRLESYIKSHPDFLTSLTSYPEDPSAPPIVREMISATKDINVGPMASVAGAIAQFVGIDLLKIVNQVIIENGGDIFMKINRPATVSIFAGESLFSEKIGLLIKPEMMPLGICSSSGRIGHSLSLGVSDLICLVSPSAIRADGAATALGNRISGKTDLKNIADWANQIEGITGGIAVVDDTMSSWGKIELVRV